MSSRTLAIVSVSLAIGSLLGFFAPVIQAFMRRHFERWSKWDVN